MSRFCGIACGVGTHLLFLLTAYRLFRFLQIDTSLQPVNGLSVDALLALGFAVPHSVLMLPKVRQGITRWIPPSFFGLLYCVVTCASLLVLMGCWRTSPQIVWQFKGVAAQALDVGFYASWGILFYSLSLTGLGYQTGWTPWWHWLHKQAQPQREFHPRGIYRWLRHPVYLSFLGLIWFRPTITLDRAMLIGIWTVYIFVGSWLKDRRLVYYVGDSYRRYQREVPGYPGMPAGPLSRVG